MFGKNKSTNDGLSTYCKTCVNEYSRIYQKKNGYKHQKKYHSNTNKTFPERHRRYYAKNKSNLVFKTKKLISARISVSIRKNRPVKGLEKNIKCSFDTFKKHIESKFLKGMNWDNYGEWEIDHIKPLATAKTFCEVLNINHYQNLQPLYKKDNLLKGSTYIE